MNRILPEELGSFIERVDHLPGLKGDRMQVPLNRSVVLGPKEIKMLKTPTVILESLVHKRTPVVAPSFSVHLRVQYENFSTFTLTNHREEPVKTTGETTIFQIEQTEWSVYHPRGCQSFPDSSRLCRYLALYPNGHSALSEDFGIYLFKAKDNPVRTRTEIRAVNAQSSKATPKDKVASKECVPVDHPYLKDVSFQRLKTLSMKKRPGILSVPDELRS